MAPSPRDDAPPPRRLVLIGMMGAGKTAVGEEVAALFGWRHLDLDREVEREAGTSVAELFAREGEAGFRAREAAASHRLAEVGEVVISPGGGWILLPGALESLGPATLSVWLRVSPETALRRIAASGGERPLLAGPDPLGTLRRLLATREALYRRAALSFDTDGRSVSGLARAIASELRARGGRAAPAAD